MIVGRAVVESIHLVTDSKYYNISVSYDLLGDLVVVSDYGSRISNHHHRLIKRVESKDEAIKVVKRIVNLRLRHGYEEVCRINRCRRKQNSHRR